MSTKAIHYLSIAIQVCNGAALLANTYFGVNAPLTVSIGAFGIFLTTLLHSLAGPPAPAPVSPTADTVKITKP